MESGAPTTSRPRWLVLSHELPSRSSNARVATWRRLKAIGALPLRSSVYLLPNTDACAADFQWMRAQIGALRGTAVVFLADTADLADSKRLVDMFRQVSMVEYRRLLRDIERLRASLGRVTHRAARADGRQRQALRRLLERREDVERRDFFRAEGREAVMAAIDGLGARGTNAEAGSRAAAQAAPGFQGRLWVTRPRPGVDRMASAWLIRRFIDPGATFGFVPQPVPGAVTFDMPDGQFTHRGSLCTFEVLADHFHVGDPAVRRLAQLVHALDLKDGRYDVPGAIAVERLINGLRATPGPDSTLLEQGIALFEVLAASPGAEVNTRRPRAARQTASRPTSRRQP